MSDGVQTVAHASGSDNPRSATYNRQGVRTEGTTNRDSWGVIVSRKKKKKKPARPRQVIPFSPRPAGQGTQPFFEPGAPVRVKAGVRDPDFPEIDLGGWTGTVLDVNSDSIPQNVHLLWTEGTIERLEPAWIERCEMEGLDFTSIWLAETDLEVDTTRPVQDQRNFQTAGRLLPRPGGLDEQERRISSALGVPAGAEIPLVSGSSLLDYQRYLASRLTFPLPCRDLVGEEEAEAERVSLVGLLPFTGEVRAGLVAEIRRGDEPDFVPLSTLSVEGPPEAHRIVEDYAFWFWSHHPIPVEGGEWPLLPTGDSHPAWSTIKEAAAYATGGGATTGALLATEDNARYGLWVGMGVLGLLGYVAGARYGRVFGAVNGMRFGSLYGGLFGAMAGVLFGAAVGVMVVGALGTIPGAILGSIIGTVLASRKWEPIGRNSWAPLGACIGGLVLASWIDRNRAFTGALIGAASGCVLAAVAVMMLFVTVGLASRGTK